jgi:hypothetical protein
MCVLYYVLLGTSSVNFPSALTYVSFGHTPASLKVRCEYHLYVTHKSPLSLSQFDATHSYPSFVVFRLAQHWSHLRPRIPSRLLPRSQISRLTFCIFSI